MGNKNFSKARRTKNDEYYTRIEDIEKEMQHYTRHFKDKVILMPCDDPALMRSAEELSNDEKSSKFWVFFHKNFDRLGLKKIIATHYNEGGKSYKIEYEGGDDNDVLDYVKTDLEGDGDFRSDEIVEIMRSSDIVVTNPPFSLFREFVEQLSSLKLKYIIIGTIGASTFKSIFKLIKAKEIHWGVNYVQKFLQPDNTYKTFGNITWYTNIQHSNSSNDLILYKKYAKDDYVKFSNYDAINVNKVKDIPMDYNGIMGVPISFLKKHNPSDFKIIGLGTRFDVEFINDQRFTHKEKRNLKIGLLWIPAKASDTKVYIGNTDGKKYVVPYVRLLIQKI